MFEGGYTLIKGVQQINN